MKSIKNIWSMSISFMLFLALFSCSGKGNLVPDKEEVENGNTEIVDPVTNLSAEITDNANELKISWNNSDEAVSVEISYVKEGADEVTIITPFINVLGESKNSYVLKLPEYAKYQVMAVAIDNYGKRSDKVMITATPAKVSLVTFQNPLIDVSRADPYVAQKDGYYYFMYTRGSNIGLRKTTKMSSLSSASEKVVWTPPSGSAYSSNLWAPEIHFLSGKWYIYFAANDGGGDSHRMYVLENENNDPTTGTWTFKGKIADPSDQWAIDGSVLTIGNANYFIWSGWENVATRYKQYIYIAPMSNPWTISGERVKISSPTNNWEKYEPSGSLGAGVNEGPIMLQRDANSPVFIIYSASRYSSDNYCLAQIQLKDGGNPLNASDWINKKQVFVKSDANAVYGPGHNGFFTSNFTNTQGVSTTENWFIYHARSEANSSGSSPRTPRMQKLTWNSDGSPNFGIAQAIGQDIPAPIGENNN